MAISVPVGVLVFLNGVLIAGTAGLMFRFSPTAYLFLALAGIVHFVWGGYWNYSTIRAVVTNLAGPDQTSKLH